MPLLRPRGGASPSAAAAQAGRALAARRRPPAKGITAAGGRWTAWPAGSAAASPRCSSRPWSGARASTCARTTTSSTTSRGTRRRRSCSTTATVTPRPGPPAWRGGEPGGAARAGGRVVGIFSVRY